MRENVAYFWDETKHFCTFHQKFVDNNDYCKKWKKEKPLKEYTDREIKRIMRRVDREYRRESKKKR